MNKTILIGRLTRDVDLRYTQSGKAVGNFTLAVNRNFKNEQGEYDADFINCVAWGKTAENLANYMKKGNQIAVDGRIQTRTYENNEGKTVYVTEVVAENVQFLESRNTSGKPNSSQSSEKPSSFAENGQPIDIENDDLPF